MVLAGPLRRYRQARRRREAEAQERANAWIADELLWTLRRLAAEPEQAFAGYLDRRLLPDELANDLDQWITVAASNGLLSPEPLAALRGIDHRFAQMSGTEHAKLWTPEAFVSHPFWAAQRERARAVLTLLGKQRRDDELVHHAGDFDGLPTGP